MIINGLCVGISILCSQAYGANEYRAVDSWFKLGTFLALLACIPVQTAWFFTSQIIDSILPDSGTYVYVCMYVSM